MSAACQLHVNADRPTILLRVKFKREAVNRCAGLEGRKWAGTGHSLQAQRYPSTPNKRTLSRKPWLAAPLR